jgi:hypothetical protein
MAKGISSSTKRGKARDFVIETNRTRNGRSARAVAAYINRWAGDVVAELVPHKTTIRVRGISLRDLASILRNILAPRIGSAIIARATGFTAGVWLLSLRGNRLITRIA